MTDRFTGREAAAGGGCGGPGEETTTGPDEDQGFEMFIRAWLEILDTVRS
ncbi:hypothetical protein VSH64_09860 [Amycolatopsis rhabdoformis]|uniref:Uncharacterized protein n=1 Tax=Amycolatopsis rhabdoformis TaxID=1448059 RepID=A0ABZ1IDQ8_9PSEU|nr:hypothetical protein [Amycolatopsis rhabdoformis]WSE32407.1 hypothetical protein VSH64_09860 [Amycolatopsis rhabdoformis]